MIVKLSDAFDLQMGKTPDRNDPACWGGAHKWVSIADLTKAGKYITDTKECITDRGIEKSGIKPVPKGTVIMSFKLSIGKTAITTEEIYTNEAIMAFIDKGTYEIDTNYIYHLFSGKDWLEGSNKAVLGLTLNKATLSQKTIELPPLAVQKKVVEVLDRMDSLISLRKKQLQKLDDLVKSRFVETCVSQRYPLIAMDDLSLAKGEYGAQSASAKYDPSRPRYVRITDINDDGTLNDDMVSSSCIEDDIQYSLSYGDFLFARMGATVGKPYAYKSGNQIFAGYLIRYKLNLQRILPEYLFVYTQLEEYKKWVQLNQSGAAQPGINAKKYGSLLIPVAPLEEQKNFRYFVQRVDKSKLTVRQGLDKLELLKQSLMQKYFG